MVALEEVGELVGLPVLVLELLPQAGALLDVESALPGIAQPDSVGLVLELSAVAGQHGRGAKAGAHGGELASRRRRPPRPPGLPPPGSARSCSWRRSLCDASARRCSAPAHGPAPATAHRRRRST